MGELNWTAESERWLKDIYEYIAADNPNAAADTLRGIISKAEVLRQHPRVGYKYEGSEREVRILLYGHYRIAYLIKPDEHIDVLGVFHGALDIERYLL